MAEQLYYIEQKFSGGWKKRNLTARQFADEANKVIPVWAMETTPEVLDLLMFLLNDGAYIAGKEETRGLP